MYSVLVFRFHKTATIIPGEPPKSFADEIKYFDTLYFQNWNKELISLHVGILELIYK